MSEINEQKKQEAAETISHSVPTKSGGTKQYIFAATESAAERLAKSGYTADDPNAPLKMAIAQLSGDANKKAPALAFTESPNPGETYQGLYKVKRGLIPDEVLKQVRLADHLVACILRARGGQISMFGHLCPDRFGTGIKIAVKPEIWKMLSPDQQTRVSARIKRLESILLGCGETEGLEDHQQLTLADFLDLIIRDGLTYGRFAVEVIYDRSKILPDGNYAFERFRPVDTATIKRPIRKGEGVGNNFRANAMKLLADLTGDKPAIDLKKLDEDEYAWIQVVDQTPRQAFTHKEMLVYSLFPSTDIEHNGYPVSPLDTVSAAVTTHISIDAYQKLYFQNGRASKGMLVIQSDEVDEQILNGIKIQFNASINNVGNSFRTPIFGMGSDDTVQWIAMDDKMGDSDYAFMYDAVARNILATFSMSPDELPGYGHLSKGTNSQTLSESSNEFKLTAARDTGLRPLILKLQTFINQRLIPLIDASLAKIVDLKLCGLDAQSKEQESTRLQQDMPTHMTYNEVLSEVDKDPLAVTLGGDFPFNERLQLVQDKFNDVGELMSVLLRNPAAMVDPLLRYKRDPFHLQNLQLISQINPNAVMAQLMPRPFAIEILKMMIEDELEDDFEIEDEDQE